MNIVQMQESLKDLSDQQLYSQLQGGATPPYLVLAEFSRRKRTRESVQQPQGQEPTVADELTAGGLGSLPAAQNAAFAARPEPGTMPQGMPPVQKFQEGGPVDTQTAMWERRRAEQEAQARARRDALIASNRERMGLPPLGQERGPMIDAATGRPVLDLIPKDMPSQAPTPAAQPPVSVPPNVGLPTARAVGGDTAALLQEIQRISDPAEREAALGAMERSYPGSTTQVPPSDNIGGTGTTAPTAGLPAALAAAPAAENYLGIDMKGGIADLQATKAPEPDTTFAKQYLADLKSSISGREKDNLNMSLIRAGLATMSGTSQFALENLGKGLTEGLNAYAEGRKGIDDLRRDIAKTEMEMEKARNSNDMELFKAKQAQLYALLQMSQKAVEGGLDRDTQVRVAEISASKAAAAADRAASAEDTRMKRQAVQFIASLEDNARALAIKSRDMSVSPEDRAQYQADLDRIRATIATYSKEFSLPMAPPPPLPPGRKEALQAAAQRMPSR